MDRTKRNLAMDSSKRSILILGLGNDLLKDDGVGIEVVRQLQGILDPAIHCVEASTPGLGLIDYLVEYDKIIIIDAVVLDHENPGRIFEGGLEELGKGRAVSPHYLGLAEIKEIAQWLSLAFPQELKIIAIAIDNPLTRAVSITGYT